MPFFLINALRTNKMLIQNQIQNLIMTTPTYLLEIKRIYSKPSNHRKLKKKPKRILTFNLKLASLNIRQQSLRLIKTCWKIRLLIKKLNNIINQNQASVL